MSNDHERISVPTRMTRRERARLQTLAKVRGVCLQRLMYTILMREVQAADVSAAAKRAKRERCKCGFFITPGEVHECLVDVSSDDDGSGNDAGLPFETV